MMRRLMGLVCVVMMLMMVSPIARAQESDFRVQIKVESAFTRVLPAFDAEPAASVFREERLEVVSRNLDGTWFEVRRIGRLNNLGWVYYEVLERYSFRPEFLPLGDVITGVIGPKPLTVAPAYAAHLVQGANIRERPSRRSYAIFNTPPLVTVPVMERNQDGSWLHINYLGYDGWIAAANVRKLDNVLDIPIAPGLAPLDVPTAVIIPVELQQAQIDRLRDFINTRTGVAVQLEQFWWAVFRGEIMPCDAPEEITYYPYTEQDVQQLPELGRYVPRLITAIDYLKTARDPFTACGIVRPGAVIAARDAAINARIIFSATLESLVDLEENVVQARR